MVLVLSPAVPATSRKLTPSGVPARGETGPGGGATGLASYDCVMPLWLCSGRVCSRNQGGAAIVNTSLKGKTRAVRLSDLMNFRRFIPIPPLPQGRRESNGYAWPPAPPYHPL